MPKKTIHVNLKKSAHQMFPNFTMSNMVFEQSSTLVERKRERESVHWIQRRKRFSVKCCIQCNKYAVPTNIFQIYNVLSVISQLRLLHSVDF